MAHNPPVSTYKVKKGDTLWTIAKTQYGDPDVWPIIKKANRLAKGKLILIGQTLTLPSLTHGGPAQPHAVPHLSGAGNIMLSEANQVACSVMCPGFKIDLTRRVPKIEIIRPGARITIKLNGDLSFQECRTDPNIEFSQNGINVTTYKSEVNTKLNMLVSDANINYDLARGTASLSCGLAVAAKIDGKVFATSKMEPAPPPPGVKYIYEPRAIKGNWNGFTFVGTFGYEAEVHPNQQNQPKSFAPAVNVPGVWVPPNRPNQPKSFAPAFNAPGAWVPVAIVFGTAALLLVADMLMPANIPENAVEFSEVLALARGAAALP